MSILSLSNVAKKNNEMYAEVTNSKQNTSS